MSLWNGLQNIPAVTEVPEYAVSRKNPADRFFTKRQVARHCCDVFEKTLKDCGIDSASCHYVEPSAGEGRFLDLMPEGRRTGIDLSPRREDIEQADFLTWFPTDAGTTKYVVLGNPPFGHRGALAFAFMKRCFLFADAVGFILPMSFYSNGKGSNMKRTEEFASLIHNEFLDADAFYLPDSADSVKVRSVFQVWIKGASRSSAIPAYDVGDHVEIYTCCTEKGRECGFKQGRSYDCYVASSFYGDRVRVVTDFKNVLYNTGYGIVIKDETNRNGIMQALHEADWERYCSDATSSCRHIRKHHLQKLLFDAGFGKKV